MQRMWVFCQIQAGGNQIQNKLTAALLRRINSLFRSYLSGKAKPQRSMRDGVSHVRTQGCSTQHLSHFCGAFSLTYFSVDCKSRMPGLLILRSAFLMIHKNNLQQFPISYWHYPSNYAKIGHKENTAFYRRERKKAPAEMLRRNSTSLDVYVLETHKHPPESRRRRCFDYNTPFANFQVTLVKMKKYF